MDPRRFLTLAQSTPQRCRPQIFRLLVWRRHSRPPGAYGPHAGTRFANNGRGETSPDAGDLDDLAGRFSDLARTLQDEDSVDETLHAIVDAAVGTVPGAQYAALSVVEHRRQIHTRAGTADLVYKVDQVQYDTGEGPCLSAVYDQRIVSLPDMSAEQRWPKFTGRTAALGVLSMLSFQLYVQQDNLGALNLYSEHKNAFDDDSEHIGLLFASHAAVDVRRPTAGTPAEGDHGAGRAARQALADPGHCGYGADRGQSRVGLGRAPRLTPVGHSARAGQSQDSGLSARWCSTPTRSAPHGKMPARHGVRLRTRVKPRALFFCSRTVNRSIVSTSRHSSALSAGLTASGDLNVSSPRTSLRTSLTVTSFDGTVLLEISRHAENAAAALLDSSSPLPLVVVDVVGDIDLDTAPLLLTALTHAVKGNRHVCCDLSRVGFLGAAGVNTILAALRTADDTGCAFTVRGVHGLSARVFQITGLDTLLAA